jgi:predicted DCC family thiol-disulfide oxidoreductase YuxK
VLIFDGACGICTAAAEWVRRRDTAGRLLIVPYQHADPARLSPGLTAQMCSRSAYLVWPDGRRWRGARAIFGALRHLPGVWSLIGVVGALPPLYLLAEPFYRLVAANRTRVSRWLGLTACAVPPGSNAAER